MYNSVYTHRYKCIYIYIYTQTFVQFQLVMNNQPIFVFERLAGRTTGEFFHRLFHTSLCAQCLTHLGTNGVATVAAIVPTNDLELQSWFMLSNKHFITKQAVGGGAHVFRFDLCSFGGKYRYVQEKIYTSGMSDISQCNTHMRTMVLEYLPTFTRTKSTSYVGTYTSTMVRTWDTARGQCHPSASLLRIPPFVNATFRKSSL